MKRTAKPRVDANGYTFFPRGTARPYCDMCGPFASWHLRKVGEDEFGPIWRCKGCDNEE